MGDGSVRFVGKDGVSKALRNGIHPIGGGKFIIIIVDNKPIGPSQLVLPGDPRSKVWMKESGSPAAQKVLEDGIHPAGQDKFIIIIDNKPIGQSQLADLKSLRSGPTK